MRELRSEPDRSKWYRLPERESVKHVTSLPIGTRITTARQIARVGYYYEPNDAPIFDIAKMRIPFLEGRLDHTVNEREMNDLIKALGIKDDQFYRWVDYQNRGRWQRSKSAGQDYDGMRVAWYQNCDYSKDYPLTITGTKAAWQGEYYAPDSWVSHTEYGDEHEYEPGGLSNRAYLKYYICEESWSGRVVFVHPLDALEVKK
jgi:hypothetical protein